MNGIKRGRFLHLVILVLLSLALLGGCGGGGGGDGTQPGPSVPNVPDSPSTPGNEVAIAALEGRWVAVAGSGTATQAGRTLELRLESAQAEFRGVNRSGDTATVLMTSRSNWKAYENGTYVADVPIDEIDPERIPLNRTARNKWQSPPDPDDPEDRFTLIFTSETQAEVLLQGEDEGVNFDLRCTMHKR